MSIEKVQVNASKKYDVCVGEGILKDAGKLISDIKSPCRAAVVTDSNVDKLYAKTVEDSLLDSGFEVCKYVFPAGEASKNTETYTEILEFLAENKITRSDIIVALGGGVCGDMAGFSAATYLRGIEFVQIPTTFLAAADSSVGGKTAVNLKAGKNLVGAFHQPSLVICDTQTFDTLSDAAFADGVAESLKHGLIADESFFETIANGNASENIEFAVKRDVEIKSRFVAEDEFDSGIRQMLNFGHTIGHTIEKCSNFEITHGHAVAMGMVCASRAAFKLGFSECDCAGEIEKALLKYGIETKCPFDADTLFAVATSDKKRMGDNINIVCLETLGKGKLVKIPISELREFIAAGL